MERNRFFRRNRRGSVAVLAAVLLPSLALSLLALIEGSRFIASQSRGETVTRLAVCSMLGCYDENLYADYGIYGMVGDERELQERAEAYVKGSVNLNDLTVRSDTYALTQTRWIKANMTASAKSALAGRALEDVLFPEQHEIETEEAEEHPMRTLKNESALERLPSRQLERTGFLGNMDWSAVSLDLSTLIAQGSQSAWINCYIRTHFGTFAEPDENGFYCGETEYILAGEAGDEANKREVKAYLIALRTSLNLLYLETNERKQEEAFALAALLTGPAAAWTEQAILAAWALAEATCDVNRLFQGKRVPLYKTDGTWSLSAEGLERYLRSAGEDLSADETPSAEGLTYADYLTLLLFFEDTETRVLRAMDVIQLNMEARYDSGFAFDHCYAGLTLTVTWHDTHTSLLPVELRTHVAQKEGCYWAYEGIQ